MKLSCPSAGTCTALGEFTYDSDTNFASAAATSSAGVWSDASQVPGVGVGFTQMRPKSLSCASATDCTSFEILSNFSNGVDVVQTEVGGVWATPVSTPNLLTWNEISCWSPGNCLALGLSFTPVGIASPAYMKLTGGSWGSPHQIMPPLLLGASDNGVLWSLACRGPGDCIAVGAYGYAGALQAAAVTFRDGVASSVALDRTGALSKSSGFLDVVCPSASTCFAEGFTGNDPASAWLASIDATQHFSRPGPPTHLDAHVVRGGIVLLTWDPPVIDGGAPVTGYTSRLLGTTKSCRSVKRHCLLSGLVAGHRYRAVVFDTTAAAPSPSATRVFVAT